MRRLEYEQQAGTIEGLERARGGAKNTTFIALHSQHPRVVAGKLQSNLNNYADILGLASQDERTISQTRRAYRMRA